MASTSDSFFTKLAQSTKSIVKIALSSHHCRITAAENPDNIIILGNGPSLADTIRDFSPQLAATPTLAVNFAANTPEFRQLRPRYYVLADPHFFASGNENVDRLIANINAVDWTMTLFLPFVAKGASSKINSEKVKIEYYNAIGVEGFQWLENAAFKSGRGMPRPRNVLIPSIMIALKMGYKNVWVAGADHSWTKTLSVNERNEVVSIQPHFYKEDEKEERRIRTDYLRYPLHQILYSFYVAFRSYFTIQRYAESRDVKIFNVTPDSFIDAFPRASLNELKLNKIN
ncbi:MAG: hypothetical protein IK120_09395 [Muribaculaceae bacterium]|nr:hypothetical protein [Muribaculaceae bacterium]